MPEVVDASRLFQQPPFAMQADEKNQFLLSELNHLTILHYEACPEYKALFQKFDYKLPPYSRIEDVPFLPVRLFKHFNLLSVPREAVIKTMMSSGTSGQRASQIYLDKETSALQVKVLSKIMADFIGPKRLPMLVIDSRATVVDRYKFSARTAGILGFSMFGRQVEFALNDDMSIDLDRVDKFLVAHRDEDILIFGFTFVVWKYFVLPLQELTQSLPLQRGILVHGGGWKQLLSESVSNEEFQRGLTQCSGVTRVHNYYGMVEQTGSIFMECQRGYLHASSFSDVIIRDPIDFKELPANQRGLIQLLSTIPHSYPGHSLLSEDEGEYLGIDDCACGRMGRYFKVHGRIRNAEVRGCSDTYSR
jgi:phenylacetate-coenzyme A ligase PaaK-like adenylate-forming protein